MRSHGFARLLGSLACAAALTLVLSGAGFVTASTAEAGTYSGDDQGDAFVGTGGLILPGGTDDGVRSRVAGCSDCHWRLTSPCFGGGSGTAFDGSSGCGSVVRGCPGGRRIFRTWLARGESPWEDLGIVCIKDIVTVAGASRALRDRLADHVPPLAPRAQPASGAVVHIPVLVDTGQAPGLLEMSPELGGLPTRLEARADWTWQWGDGAVTHSTEPGCAYPCTSLGHAYRRAGSYRAQATATWRGTFWIDGLGPFAVEEPVVQAATLDVVVGEGRALLAVP